jgi:hypothetical protein
MDSLQTSMDLDLPLGPQPQQIWVDCNDYINPRAYFHCSLSRHEGLVNPANKWCFPRPRIAWYAVWFGQQEGGLLPLRDNETNQRLSCMEAQ